MDGYDIYRGDYVTVNRADWEGILSGWAMGGYGSEGFWFTTLGGHDVPVSPGYLICNFGPAQEGYDFAIDTEYERQVYNGILRQLNQPLRRLK